MSDDSAAAHGHDKGGGGLHHGLKVVGGEDAEGQQQERNTVPADDTGGDAQDAVRGRYEDADESIGNQFC